MSTTREDAERFEGACAALHAGEITRDEFARRTFERWRRTGAYLFSRFRKKLPSWVEADDVAQELYLLSVQHVATYDRGRANGKSIGQYVAWTTIHRGQRLLDHWRGASLSGNHGKNPSRAEISFTRAFGPDVDPLDRHAVSSVWLEEKIDEYGVALEECGDLREALALVALRRAGGSPGEAARLLFGSMAARVELGLRNEVQAREVVEETVVVLAERVDRRAPVPPPADLFEDDEEAAEKAVEAAKVA